MTSANSEFYRSLSVTCEDIVRAGFVALFREYYVQNLIDDVSRIQNYTVYGRIATVQGLLLEVAGLHRSISIGSRCAIGARDGREVPAEVVGFRNDRALLMPFGSLEGIGMGCKAILGEERVAIFPHQRWLGRVINGFAEPIDSGPPLVRGTQAVNIKGEPPPAHSRQRVGDKINVGVRAINTFMPCCRGQRMGIFSGSGVGKSILLSMLSRYTDSDVIVIGLIGERGREVQEFIANQLGPEGLARSVVVVATSDEPALMRRQAAYLTMAVSEYFRDHGLDVLCLMDSVTRFAMAQREIGLSGGEPPAVKGYTPSVFAELPKLLERAGPGPDRGSITGLFSVLVEGDDHNEPIADAVRAILDGHIVLDRSIAERGRYPAINVLKSISRMMPDCNTAEETSLISKARRLLSTYEDMSDLIRIGAYRAGSDTAVDEAIHYHQALEQFLSQDTNTVTDLDDGFAQLNEVLGDRGEA